MEEEQVVETPSEESTEQTEETVEETVEEKKYKLKIDGEEVEVTEDELIREAQKARASDKRFRDAAQKEKMLTEKLGEFEAIKYKPVESLKKLGIDFDKLAEEHLLKRLEMEQMSPDAKKAYELEQKQKEYEEQLNEYRTKEEQAEIDAEAEKYVEQYRQEFERVIKEKELPDTDNVRARLATYMYDATNEQLENFTVEEAAELVKEDFEIELKQLFDKYSLEDVEKILGKDVLKKIRKADLDKVVKPENNAERGEPSKPKNKKKYMTPEEWQEYISSIAD